MLGGGPPSSVLLCGSVGSVWLCKPARCGAGQRVAPRGLGNGGEGVGCLQGVRRAFRRPGTLPRPDCIIMPTGLRGFQARGFWRTALGLLVVPCVPRKTYG